MIRPFLHLALTIVAICGLALTGCGGPPSRAEAAWPAGCAPQEVGRRVVDNLLARPGLAWYLTPEGIAARRHMFIFGHPALHYAEICTARAALDLAGMTGDSVRRDRLVARYDLLRRPEGGILYRYESHVDVAVFGIVPIAIHRHGGDREWLRMGIDYADRQWEERETTAKTLEQRRQEGDSVLPPGLSPQTRWWIDDMYMIGILQVEAFRATRERKYADRAAEELTAYVERLQQPSGLFFHAPNAPWFWSRGNGWVASGLAEVLGILPDDHPRRAVLLRAYRSMMAALAQHQSPEGLWRQIIDKDDAWLETSGTAMFGNAIAMGVQRGWLDAPAFDPVWRKAWAGLCRRLDAAGDLAEVCEGTNKSRDIAPYYTRKRITGDFHGQAPLLWFANTLMRAD